MIKIITDYFRNTENYSTGRFIAEMFVVVQLFKIIIIILSVVSIIIYEPFEIILFGETDESASQFIGLTWVGGLIIVCVIFPSIESIIGQFLPVWILSFITKNRFIYVIICALWFTYLHLQFIDKITFIIIIFMGGIIFAWCFVVYKEKGVWKAILVTTAVHSLSNFISFIIFYLI